MMTGIVVVSYHNAKGTQKYITEQLPRLTDNYRVVVIVVDADKPCGQQLATNCGLAFVDNPKRVADHAKGWCISVQDNLGYAKGNNWGVEILKGSGMKFDYYLFSNDDIEIMSPNMLSVLATTMDNNDSIAGTGPRVIGLDGSDQSPHTKYISPLRQIGWKLFSFLRNKHKVSMVYSADSSISVAEASRAQRKRMTAKQAITLASKEAPTKGVCYWVSGAFFMVKAEKFEAVGGFDPRTFLYFEEAILAERFMQRGWTFAFEPSVTVVHYEGGSTTVKSAMREAVETESRMLYYKEYKHVNAVLIWVYRLVRRL